MKTPTTSPENRRYRVIAKHNFSGSVTILFPGPLTHVEACKVLASVTKYDWRTETVEEIAPPAPLQPRDPRQQAWSKHTPEHFAKLKAAYEASMARRQSLRLP